MRSNTQKNTDELHVPDIDSLILAIESDNIAEAIKLCTTVKIYDMSPTSGKIPFFVAINKDNQNMIESLLTNGMEASLKNASPEYRRKYFMGKSLYMAVALNDEKMVEALLKIDNTPHYYNLTSPNEISLLHMAAFRGNLRIVQLLTEILKLFTLEINNSLYSNNHKRQTIWPRTVYPIYLAALTGNEELVNYLEHNAGYSATVDIRYESLITAIKSNEIEAANLLYKPYGEEWLFSIAVRNRNVTLLQFSKATLDKINTALYDAASYNNTKQAKFLCENGADVNAIINGETPLYRAISKKNLAMAQMLIEDFKADVNITTGYYYTALDIAVDGRAPENLALVKLLIKHGADIFMVQDLKQLRPQTAASKYLFAEQQKLAAELFDCEVNNGPSAILAGPERVKQLLCQARKTYKSYAVSEPVEYMSALLGGGFRETYCFESNIDMNKYDIKNILMSDNENEFIEFLNSIRRNPESLRIETRYTYTPYLNFYSLHDDTQIDPVDHPFQVGPRLKS